MALFYTFFQDCHDICAEIVVQAPFSCECEQREKRQACLTMRHYAVQNMVRYYVFVGGITNCKHNGGVCFAVCWKMGGSCVKLFVRRVAK